MTSCRLKILTTAAVFAGAVALTGSVAFAGHGAVPKTLLELDGDLNFDNTAPSTYDWDTAAVGTNVDLLVDEVDPVGGLQMTQGTKDIHNVGDWIFKTVAKVTPKDDLRRILKAFDVGPGPDQVLFLAAQRGDATGTTTFG